MKTFKKKCKYILPLVYLASFQAQASQKESIEEDRKILNQQNREYD